MLVASHEPISFHCVLTRVCAYVLMCLWVVAECIGVRLRTKLLRSNPHPPRGPTLSEVRALVGEGCEGYPPKGPLSLLERLPGVEGPARRET